MKDIGIYIHIPFCIKKCNYCDFISYSNKNNLIEEYIISLKKEIEFYKDLYIDKNITTIYIGGGTPSCINSKFIIEILKTIFKFGNISRQTEITIEVNPGTLDIRKVEDYKSIGINRISLGLQTSNNMLLKQLGRIHMYEDFIKAYQLIKEFNFSNVNVDLMIGIPGQTRSDVLIALDNIIKLEFQHISVYGLIIEPNTKLEELINMKKLSPVNDEEERKMYWNVKSKLEQNGYKHYEISNYAKPRFESKHNMSYWQQKEYLGFGLSASTYYNNIRSSNIINLEKYINYIQNEETCKIRKIEEVLNKIDTQKEYIMLGFRKIQGINLKEYKLKFGEDILDKFSNEIKKLKNQELIEIKEEYIKLSEKGLDLANLVFQEFI